VNGGSSVLARMTEPVGVGVNHIEFPEKSGTMKAEPEHGSESKE
jgi:hypothetical protein